jgi:alpha-amylase
LLLLYLERFIVQKKKRINFKDGPNDFNNKKCQTATGNIENYQDINQVRNCKLVELPDLDLSTDYVKQKLVDYMNYLIDLGVAGFRIGK